MSDAAYKRWVNTEWWHEDYHQLWRAKGEVPPSMEADLSIQQEECGPRDIAIPEDETTRNQSRTDVQQNVIYLTADSEEELTELKPEVIYIIGGICDHNRYKVAPPPSYLLQMSGLMNFPHSSISVSRKPTNLAFELRVCRSDAI
jgi:tRNA (guanine9-N1)-methyltransferase